MLYRKIEKDIIDYLNSSDDRILIVDGARQVGKSYIIRHIATTVLKDRFKNYIEINFVDDYNGKKDFMDVYTTDDFYFRLSTIAGERMQKKENTLVFLDEIQQYPQFLTMLKFLRQENRFTYICSGSLLGVTLKKTTSIPMGSIERMEMYPLDFEEFLMANGFAEEAIEYIRKKFNDHKELDDATHQKMMDLFRKYLLVGGLPDAVNAFVENKNMFMVRKIQNDIHDYYGDDASKYDEKNKLKIKRIYDMIPSTLENKKKRIRIQNIENIKGKHASDYQDEFDYLIHSGIALEVKALSQPVFPLIESSEKNLLKLYMNDVGILTGIYYQNNVNAILNDERSINLGTVYETVVASELKAHGHSLFYYDNKKKGEVDFLINDYESLSVLPIEVKSGKDYTIHNAISKFLEEKDGVVQRGIVLSNNRIIKDKNGILYLPIYYVMFL